MALIKCPECGREDVSEYAEACPSCGFVIREYVQLVKKREEQEIARQRSFNLVQNERIRRLNKKIEEAEKSLEEKLKKIDTQDPITSKPNIFIFFMKNWIVFLPTFIFTCLTFCFSIFLFNSSQGFIIQFVLGGMVFYIGCGGIIGSFKGFKEAYQMYEEHLKAYEEQKSMKFEEYKIKKRQEAIDANEKYIDDLNQKCFDGECF